jgi:glycosyltransferase involved in cell wall biosynthesis
MIQGVHPVKNAKPGQRYEQAPGRDGPTDPTTEPVVLHTRVITAQGGGPEKTILNSPRFLASLGYRALCAFMHPADDPGFDVLRCRATKLAAPLISIPDGGLWDIGVARRLLRLCQAERVSIWHAHDYKSNALGLLLRRFHPMRLVTTVHGWVDSGSRLRVYYALDRMCLRHYEKVICVSDDLRQMCLKAGVARGRCVLIENAIDVDQCQRRLSPAEAKRGLGLPEAGLLIGACGRLSAEKGFEHLILAIDMLLNEGLDATLVILGEGELRPKLQELIDRLGRHDRIQLAGYQADLAAWYQAMDVFALSSLREGLPNVVLEALAWRLPVVATSIAGVPAVVQDNVSGLLVAPGDVGSLAGCLRRLAFDDGLRQRLSAAGRQTIEERYSFARRMEKIRRVYDDLLSA